MTALRAAVSDFFIGPSLSPGGQALEPDPKDRCVLAEPMIHCADWERRDEERCGPTSIGECIAATFKVRQCAVQFRMSFDTLRLLSGGRQRQRLELGKASYFRMAGLGPADARST